MKILFLGYVVSPGEANTLSGASVAGNTMQLELIRELCRMPGVDVDVHSILPLATYPKEPSILIRASTGEISPGVHSYRPGFLTLPVLKQLSQIASLTSAVSKAATRTNFDYVLTFNMFPHVGVAAWWVRKRYGVPVACLLADPPIDTGSPRGRLASAAFAVYNAWAKRLLKVPDRVISLTPQAARRFAPQARAIAIDGAIPVSLDAPHSNIPVDPVGKAIVFTGALMSYNGIVELVEAMRLVTNPEVVLHIYGGGPLSGFVDQAAKASDNIVFHGKVDSSLMPDVQRDAFLLINPRQIDHPLSDFTFPSKVLEYLASGTPVLTTRLRCFSSEYENVLYFADAGSAEDLALRIDAIASLPRAEVEEVGQRGRRFVLTNRTWVATARRILRFLTET